MATINNTAFDAALAAVPAPYGPLTRTGTTTDLNTVVFSNNDTIAYEVKSTTSGLSLNISYVQLQNPEVRDQILQEAHGLRTIWTNVKTFASELVNALNGVNLLTVDAKFFPLIQDFASYMPGLGLKHRDMLLQSEANNPVTAEFAITGSGATRGFTNQTTGTAFATLWIFGNGNFSGEFTPPNQTFSTGTTTIRLLVVGTNGISVKTRTVTVS